MPDRIDEIYKLLIQQKDEFFRYAQQDSQDKEKIKDKLNDLKTQSDRIEEQTVRTNGRVTKLEGQFLLIEQKDYKQVVVGAVNKRWAMGILGAVSFVWSVVSVLVYAWIQKKFFN